MDNIINQWLQTFEIIQEVSQYEEIHTQDLTDNVKNLALQRTGFNELPKKYVTDDCWYRQYQYMLLLKSESESDLQRLSNNDWLDTLSDQLAKANKERNYPTFEDRECYGVSCANGITYQVSDDGAISIYALQMYFNIKSKNQDETTSL